MSYTIALPDGRHYKAPVERVPYGFFALSVDSMFLISGTVLNSRLRGYCEIVCLSQRYFKRLIGFFNEAGRIEGHLISSQNNSRTYQVTVSDSHFFRYRVKQKEYSIIIHNGVRTIEFKKGERDTISKTETVDGVATTSSLTGYDSCFTGVIDISEWEFLKPSLIGKTERVYEDPFFGRSVPSVPFQIQNTAPVENAPAGIE